MYCQSNQSRVMKTKTPSLHLSLTPRLSFTPDFSIPLSGRGGWEIWSEIGLSHVLFWSFIPRGKTPQTLPLLQCGVPPTGDRSP